MRQAFTNYKQEGVNLPETTGKMHSMLPIAESCGIIPIKCKFSKQDDNISPAEEVTGTVQLQVGDWLYLRQLYRSCTKFGTEIGIRG